VSAAILLGGGGQRLAIRDGPIANLVSVPYYSLLLAAGDISLHFIDVGEPTRSTPKNNKIIQ
jgi:hypothetical protein